MSIVLALILKIV